MDLDLDPELTPHMVLGRTGGRDGVDPKLRSKSNNPNMDLDPELIPSTSPKLTHRWDWNQRQSGP